MYGVVGAGDLVSICGESRMIEDGEDRWWLSCTQLPGHEGPHVGLVSWLESIEEVADAVGS